MMRRYNLRSLTRRTMNNKTINTVVMAWWFHTELFSEAVSTLMELDLACKFPHKPVR